MNGDKRDKVLAGMDAHRRKQCGECPYKDLPYGCVDRMLEDAMLVIIWLGRVETAIREYINNQGEDA